MRPGTCGFDRRVDRIGRVSEGESKWRCRRRDSLARHLRGRQRRSGESLYPHLAGSRLLGRRGRHRQSVERRHDPRLFFRRGRRAKPEAARRQEGQSERPCLRCDHRASSRANRYGEQRDRGRLTSLDQGRSVSLGIRCPRRVSNIESFASLSLLRAPSLVRHRGSRFSRSNRLAPWPSDLASPGAGWPSPVPCP